MRKLLLILTFIFLAFGGEVLAYQLKTPVREESKTSPEKKTSTTTKKSDVTTPQKTVKYPTEAFIENNYHIFQSFNNCGPAALSMALSYYDINVSQNVLGEYLRPYQNPQGDNDDKSVTLYELADKAQEYNLTPFYRPNGSIEIVKKFIANGIPVVTRTLLTDEEDIGHYRIIKGYNDNRQELIQDDSLQGANLTYKYSEFDILWKAFNYEYLVLVTDNKLSIAKEIIGEDVSETKAWENSVSKAKTRLDNDPNDMYARFNLSISLFHTKDYKGAVSEFEKVENKLPFRTLWYQVEPIQAYFMLGDYDKVLALTDKVLTNNKAFSEAYIIRGDVFKAQDRVDAARSEYEKAIYYNLNDEKAKNSLDTL